MQGFSKGAAASSSPENLVKMQILKTHSRPPETETQGWGPIIRISFLKKLKTFKVLDFEIVWGLHLPAKLQKSTKDFLTPFTQLPPMLPSYIITVQWSQPGVTLIQPYYLIYRLYLNFISCPSLLEIQSRIIHCIWLPCYRILLVLQPLFVFHDLRPLKNPH